MSMTRKEFLGTIVKGTALGAMAAGAIAACGGDDGGDSPDGSGVCSPRSTIVGNHGHMFTVSRADVDAGAEKTYDIMSTATHNHMVTLTAAHMLTLAGGGTVMVVSSTTQAHEHNITVNCV